MIRAFGRDFIADERDRKFKVRTKKTTATSKFWQDSAWFGDQGSSSACVGFSWAHWLTCAPVSNFLEPLGIYAMAQYIDEWEGNEYDGTSVRAGAKLLKRLGLIERYEWAATLGQLANAVLTRGPVVVGTDWFAGMSNPSRGFIRPDGKLEGGHAWLITGVNMKRKYFRMKNSWGREWGAGGRAKVGFKTMKYLLKRQGEVCLAVEKTATPTA